MLKVSQKKISASFASLLPSGHNYTKDLVAENKFGDLLKREKLRADRNGHGFSLVIFHIESAKSNSSGLNCLTKIIKERARVTDTAGWLDEKTIGCFLPDTSEAGAKKLSDNILQKLDQEGKIFSRTIYSYPFINSSDRGQYSQSGSDDTCVPRQSETKNTRTTNVENDKSSAESLCRNFELLSKNFPVTRKIYFIKRIFDILMVLPVLIVTSPLILLTALFIKLTSKGPVLFKQKRVGFRGRLFTMYKFRTMEVTTDQTIHKKYVIGLVSNKKPMVKIDECQRLIPLGKIIRQLFIDELPQLFNVLQGNMSLVGPRPAIPYEVEAYNNWHMERLHAVPGMTGFWQVSGKNRLTFDEMVRLDIKYANELSLWLDIKILLKTPLAIISEVRFNQNPGS